MEAIGEDGGKSPKFNAENVQRSKLRAWARLQLLAKWQPKKYGDKLELTGDGSNPVALTLADLYKQREPDTKS